MMSYTKIVLENMRLVVLQALEEDPDYSHNESVIQGVLSTFGHSPSQDKLRTELHWLQEQDLVTLDDIGGVLVIRLTKRGEDVALGRARVPGVARRAPGA